MAFLLGILIRLLATTMNFKDLFSTQAADYAKHRPQYPPELFAYLASLAPSRLVAWDCATGNGQAAIGLAPHFQRVIATDASANQLSNALDHENITYCVATAEDSGLETASIDLLTVAQAAHWFDFERFYAEAKRILKPQGVIALWTYTMAQIEPSIDAAFGEFYESLTPYWSPERLLVEAMYQTIPFPFDEIMPETISAPPTFYMEVQWTFADFLGYLGTWSAVQEFIKQHKYDPVEEFGRRLQPLWTEPDIERKAQWQVYMRVGRV